MIKQTLLLVTACLMAYASFAQAPTISSFSPASGPVGTLVTITGTNLSSPTAFTIGGASAIVVSDADTTLVGMVMPGAATGAVSVTTLGGSDTGSGNFIITPTLFPATQQGSILVGTGASFAAQQGYAVSLSADGTTALVGAPKDNRDIGAAWVYTRSGTVWTQQGSKLIGAGAININGTGVFQGTSVSLSADGNTAIVGGSGDDSLVGAAWVYTRSGGIWTQQGAKLIGSGAIKIFGYGVYQGYSVSLSADGNTAIVGGIGDNNSIGAAWIFTRSGGIWTQQGGKLIGTGAVNGTQGAGQGSVSISADGNTAMVGGYNDNGGLGAAWVYTRSDTTWTQQGPKLVGTGAVGYPQQGNSVALSADGNTAIVGGSGDYYLRGAAWVYTRSAGSWTQQGSKLVDTGAIVTSWAYQGWSVSLSADGNTALVGGFEDNTGPGAVWVYSRSNTNWTQQSQKLVGTGATGANWAYQGWSVSLSADGSTAIEGGYKDNNDTGAAWVFVPCSPMSSTTYDTIPANSLPYHWNGLIFNDSFPYIWGSHTYIGADSQTVLLTSTGGCDSTATLVLSIGCTPDSFMTYQDICTCDLPYHWNGLIFTDSGTQTTHLTGVGGCDIAATLVLTLYPGGISELSGQSHIHLYPNPNTGTFTLTTDNSLLTTGTYTIYDMMGQVIKQEAITSDTQLIDMGAVPPGIYMLSVTGTSQMVKFAVMR